MRAIDFFCGGGGMTCGLSLAGIDVVVGVDIDHAAKETYEYNNKKSVFIEHDIESLDLDIFEKEFNVHKNDDEMIFVGCSPCQYYSIINTDKTKSRKTMNLLARFADFVEYYRPAFVLVENVPGINSNKESILPDFLERIRTCGYNHISQDVVNLCYYGVPQTRKRFSLMATRLDIDIHLPYPDKNPSVLQDFIGIEHGFPPIHAGWRDDSDFNHSAAGLSDKCLRRLRKTRHNGGSRFDWADDPDLQLKCFEGRNSSFMDTFGRLSWDKPASTITTKFYSISNGRFGHPEEDRALSIREGATLQTFPKNYIFKTNSIVSAAKLIGNAVPCEYARRLGETIQELSNGKIQNTSSSS